MFSSSMKDSPSNSAPANALASQSQATQQQQLPTKSQSQSNSQSPQEIQQSQAIYSCKWSAHTPPSGQSSSPFLRYAHTLSTSVTSAGELFLFGGILPTTQPHRPRNDLYVISTRDLSTTLFKTSGDVPKPHSLHGAVLTSTTLLIWGGMIAFGDKVYDDSLYLLNLVSREWTRVEVNAGGPEPGSRCSHTMTLVDYKLFVFGGWSLKGFGYFNDIWALDLRYLKSNPFWELYEPAPGNEKPLPRTGHVSVTTGSRIIIFGGRGSTHNFNDTWSFDISTRKWTELQCTGPIPSPREGHAAALLGDVMYVFGGFGGRLVGGTYLGDLTALNLSTQRWIAFQDIGPSPRARHRHAMAYDGTRVFVIGGLLSPGAEAHEIQHIYVLDTKHLDCPGPDSDVINSSEKTIQLVQKSSASRPTRGQPHQPSSSLSDTRAAHGVYPFQNATREELDHPTSQLISPRQNPSLRSRPTGASGRPRRVPEEDDGSEGSTEHSAKLGAPVLPPEKEIARLLVRQLSETPVAKTERDRRIAQLTDELALKSALLERAEANVSKEKKRARLELRELQVKLDESLTSRHALEQAKANAVEEKKRAVLELRELQAKLDVALMSRDHALEQAKANVAEEKKRAGLELRELQTKLEESLMSRDHALEQAQSALHKASRVAEANEQSQRELTEIRAELEASRSESAASRLRPADTEKDCAKSKAEAGSYGNQNETGLVNTDEDRVVHRLMERMQAMEAKMASLPGNEKSFEMMECRNED